MTDERFKIVYQEDEITLVPHNQCFAVVCVCKDPKSGLKCSYTPDEAKEHFIRYFYRRAQRLRELSTAEFMQDMGFYNYKDD